MLLATFIWWEGRAAEPIIPLALFRSRVFSVANAMGFTIGMAMFGAIIFIPLYLQLVYGASPTSSGLRLLPLMAGLLVAAIASGRVISRIGRYKAFPIAGTAILVVGMFLLSRLGVGTAPWLASLYMLVVGVGIGLVMQVLVLVVQNDVPAAGDRRRHLDRDVLPLGRRLVRRRHLRDDLREPARRRALRATALASPRASGAACTSTRSRPSSSRRPSTPTSSTRSRTRCTASSSSGWRSRSVPFGLSWLLKEVPLRTTLAPAAELDTDEAIAAATPDARTLATAEP